MKRLILIFTTIIMLLATACKKQETSSAFFITALKNNIKTNFTTYSASNYKDSLYLFAVGGEETLVIKIKFSGTGKYLLSGNQAVYYNTIGQDVLISNYILGSSSESSLFITDYNQSANTISGSFNLYMIRTYGNPETSYPKNINFTDGQFKVQLPK